MTSPIRRMLVSLDALPVLRVPGGLLYRANVRLATAICRSLPDVCALYATGSMAAGDMVPGLSDIDLVVVIRDLPADREFRLVRQLETRLRFTMPPLGEDKSGTHLMIYSAAEWEAVGGILLGKRFGQPAVLFDRRDARTQDTISGRVHGLHHLLKARWRLDEIHGRLDEPAGDRLDALLRRRMIDRLLGALESAGVENDASPEGRAVISARVAEIRRELGQSRPRPGEIILPQVLPGLLVCFDLAVRHGLPAGPPSDPGEPWSDEPHPEACANAADSAELARALRSRIGDRLGDRSVWVARIGTVDFLVCEPVAEALARTLVESRLAGSGRTMRIVSPRMLAGLYLNDDFGPYAFVRLRDMRAFVAAGRPSHERALLETYAMFPRVRAVQKLGDTAVFDAYRTGLMRLQAHFQEHRFQEVPCQAQAQDHFEDGSSRNSDDAASTALRHADDSGAPADATSMARFRELRRLSHVLQKAVKRRNACPTGSFT